MSESLAAARGQLCADHEQCDVATSNAPNSSKSLWRLRDFMLRISNSPDDDSYL